MTDHYYISQFTPEDFNELGELIREAREEAIKRRPRLAELLDDADYYHDVVVMVVSSFMDNFAESAASCPDQSFATTGRTIVRHMVTHLLMNYTKGDQRKRLIEIATGKKP